LSSAILFAKTPLFGGIRYTEYSVNIT